MSAEPVLVRSPLAEEILEAREPGLPNEVILDIETTGLEPDIYRVVAIGLMDAETGEADIIFVECERDEDEGAAIERAAEALFRAERVFTWRGKGLDLPFLMARALRHGLDLSWLPGRHLDLAEVVRWFFVGWKDIKKTPSLDRMCEFLFGYKRKLRLRGRDIPDLYERWQGGDGGARETIVEHLREDLEMTRMVLGRLRPYVEAYERLVPPWWRW
ncbi:MAG: hypothetical protein DRJ69_01735 [Thermoprotei archaeon]|nr:MAG: hypothetical protein DRJ69_01735 [Thermoprotei archaeon]